MHTRVPVVVTFAAAALIVLPANFAAAQEATEGARGRQAQKAQGQPPGTTHPTASQRRLGPADGSGNQGVQPADGSGNGSPARVGEGHKGNRGAAASGTDSKAARKARKKAGKAAGKCNAGAGGGQSGTTQVRSRARDLSGSGSGSCSGSGTSSRRRGGGSGGGRK